MFRLETVTLLYKVMLKLIMEHREVGDVHSNDDIRDNITLKE